jgi:uncharacterized protein (UPF0332 family)
MASATFNWSQYFRLAGELGSTTDEAYLRSALSRAYYYVYHMALKRAEANSYKPLPNEGTHSQLWRLFGSSPEPDCQRLAAIALRLKEKRERADYESHYARVADDVPAVLAEAQQFVAMLNRLPARHPNPQSQRR